MGRRLLQVLAFVVGFMCLTQTAWALSSQPKAGVVGTDGTVYATQRIGDVIYVGGIFQNAVDPQTGETTPRKNFMALDATTGRLLPFDVPVTCENNDALITCPSAEIRAMIVDGTHLIIGGRFTAVGGTKRLMWAILNADGSVVDMESGRTNARVGAFALDGSILYVGGAFTKFYGDTTDKKLSAVNLSTSPPSIEPGFNPVVDDVVRAITVLGNHNIVFGGQFTTVNGISEPNLAELTTSNTLVPWADNPIFNLWDVTSYQGVVYAARGEGKGGKVIAYNPVGGTQYWQIGGNGDTQALTIYKGQLIAGGHWSTWDQLTGYRKLVALNLNQNPAIRATTDLSWQPQPNSTKGVWDLLGTSDALLVGGAFTKVGGQDSLHFAVFN